MSAKERSDIFRTALFSKFSGNQKTKPATNIDLGLPVIPHFTLLKKLGQGGMASVFLAQQDSTGRQVAIKIMSQHMQRDPNWINRFLGEARRLAELSHSNIVPVIDWGTHEGTGYIVMELLKGGDLTGRLIRCSITVRDVIEIVQQIASGLDFAGEKGYVHRDIKPDNILFREDGSPCILDFGIAKESSSNTTYSNQGIPIGTGAYMSPEQAQPANCVIDKRSDLYSLGVVFYQMLAGKRPFEYINMDPMQAFQLYIYAHINLQPPPLPEDFSVFQPIMDHLLAKNPENRFKRGNEFRQALTHLTPQLPAHLLSKPINYINEVTLVPLVSDAFGHASSEAATGQWGANEPTLQPNSSVNESGTDTFMLNRVRPLMVYGVAAVLLSLSVGYAIIEKDRIITIFSSFPNERAKTEIPKPEISKHQATKSPVVGDSDEPEQTTGWAKVTQQESVPSPKELLKDQIVTLMEAARMLTDASGDNLAAVKQQIEIYQKVLELNPGHVEAEREIAHIVQSQMTLVKQAISNNAFKNIPERVQLIGLLDTEVATELSSLYQREQSRHIEEIRRKKDLASLKKQIQKDVEAASSDDDFSRRLLINASTNLEKARRLGIGESAASSFAVKITDRYRDAIENSLKDNNLESAKKWLADAEKVALPRTQVSRLKSELAKLELLIAEQEAPDTDSVPTLQEHEDPQPIAAPDSVRSSSEMPEEEAEKITKPKVRVFGSF